MLPRAASSLRGAAGARRRAWTRACSAAARSEWPTAQLPEVRAFTEQLPAYDQHDKPAVYQMSHFVKGYAPISDLPTSSLYSTAVSGLFVRRARRRARRARRLMLAHARPGAQHSSDEALRPLKGAPQLPLIASTDIAGASKPLPSCLSGRVGVVMMSLTNAAFAQVQEWDAGLQLAFGADPRVAVRSLMMYDNVLFRMMPNLARRMLASSMEPAFAPRVLCHSGDYLVRGAARARGGRGPRRLARAHRGGSVWHAPAARACGDRARGRTWVVAPDAAGAAP